MALKILLVDDSSVMRKMIRRTIELSSVGVAEFYEAGNGKEGLMVLQDKAVDLLVIDINMPVMDGMEMLSKVRKQDKTKNVPILIVSTESNEKRIREIDRQNAAFIHKPFTPEILREKVLSVIEKEVA